MPLWRVPSKFARTAQAQIFLRNDKAVVGVAQGLQPRLGGFAQRRLIDKRQVDFRAPRPTRPRNWCSCARPKRSACSTTMIVASGTSTPTSMTVVATRT